MKEQVKNSSQSAPVASDRPSPDAPARRLRSGLAYTLISLLASAALVFAIEFIFRGDFATTVGFFLQPFKPGWTTVVLFTLILVALDAVLGRRHQGLMVVAPLTLVLAFIGHQKSHYLGDPLYPTDFLYVRQIVDLLPLLVRERPWTAVAMAAGLTGGLDEILRGMGHARHELFLDLVALGVLVYLEETEHHWLLCENRKRR